MGTPKKKYGGYLISEGEKFDIIAAVNKNGNSPFIDYFLELNARYKKLAEKGDIKKRNKINIDYTILREYFNRFCTHGLWHNKNQLRPLGDGFYEFKNVDTGLRVPFYYDNLNRNVIILTHYFNKSEQKTPRREIEKMKEIKKQFDEYRRLKGGTI